MLSNQLLSNPLLLVVLACGLDRLVGDPRWCPHPVVVMGWWITLLRRGAEAWAGTRAWKLRLAGGLITLVLVGGSGLAGWGMERLAPTPLLVVALASALAGRSLEQAVAGVLKALPNSVQAVQRQPVQNQTALEPARRALAWIVGRDTADLDGPEILRALAETASENGVDGLFAPLFWMLLGAGLWSLNPAWPGPLALAWGFKAASTLDSMLGYRRGRLRWLGTAGARLDDLLVWLPCRLVAVSLPLAAGQPGRSLGVLAAARRDGAADPSPNAGLSQAAYAHVTGVQLGGSNSYGGQIRSKPLLGAGLPAPDQAAVLQMLQLNRRLELIWLTAAAAGSFITKTLS
ncbi:cobalamin biosynthesis protein CobD [Cyanobium sp. Tous-M-B4]|nr:MULTISPECIES: adenosylcobinamide-phosphate synthase CbiB [unclassified Cyanobium]MCP9777066.1 cobalamin biosynthesis protein CobD [Cyanobium sp. Tous-M-B4]MCP9878129.1 cobalamin biosynthesis protein CobD [Cyanobium sp. A2C-AMD]